MCARGRDREGTPVRLRSRVFVRACARLCVRVCVRGCACVFVCVRVSAPARLCLECACVPLAMLASALRSMRACVYRSVH
eukprot:1526136-Pleurochrysis_carterae.AAC.1